MVLRKVMIASASPDRLNVNAVLRDYVVDGFRRAFTEIEAVGVDYEAAVTTASTMRPDLTVVFGSVLNDDTDYNQLADEVHRAGNRLAFWLHDDPYEFDANARIFPLADIIFTNDEASLDFYPVDVPVFHLPLGASEFAHYRRIDRRIGPDLFFCGHLFENRRTFLRELSNNSPKFSERVIAIGTGQADVDMPWWSQVQLPNSSLPGFYASAVAVLNIGRDLNLANHKYGIRASTPGPRTFEAALAGAAQIFVGSGLEITKYFEPDKEILLADSVEQFVDQWERLIINRTSSIEIGRRAQARVIEHHSYKQRAKTMINLLT
jgi:spore maturation protein CgeB